MLGNEELHEKSTFIKSFGSKAFIARIRTKYVRLFGSALSPFDAYLTLTGLATISERFEKETKSASQIARYLTRNENVKDVYYSGIDQNNKLVAKYLPKGAGSILTFELNGGVHQIRKFIENVKLFSYLPNAQGVGSLITNVAQVTNQIKNNGTWNKQKVNPQLISLSVGLEDENDLINDLDQAINKTFIE